LTNKIIRVKIEIPIIKTMSKKMTKRLFLKGSG